METTLPLEKNKRFKEQVRDPEQRAHIRKQFLAWCLIYLPHYFYLPPADFHPRLFKNLTDKRVEMLLIIGFRGSAKSVYSTLAFPLFCALEDVYKFIIVAGDTTDQTKLNIANIRKELEENALLREDYGVMYDANENWSEGRLILTNGCMILGRSRGQKVRGMRHGIYRPQLIIIDDAEALDWVKKKKNRDKTEQWVMSEVIPAQEESGSKLIIVGNLLHKNALMARMWKKKTAEGKPLFKRMKFALVKRDGTITWRGKYPDKAAVQAKKDKIGSESVWAREYMIKIIAEEDQIVKETDIQRYSNTIVEKKELRAGLALKILDASTGVDLAISEEETADFTAMVSGYQCRLSDDKKHILVLPNPINKRMDFDRTIAQAVTLKGLLPFGSKFYVEDVQYQKAALQTMSRQGLSIFPMRPVSDKTARLNAIVPFIKDGTVLFPEFGCEELLEQLIGFGGEEHDDLVDAFVYMVMGMLNRSAALIVDKPR